MMKKILKCTITLSVVLSLGLVACRQQNKKDNSENQQTEQIENEEKSTITETGQNIGNNTDSTSVDGEPGNPSNN